SAAQRPCVYRGRGRESRYAFPVARHRVRIANRRRGALWWRLPLALLVWLPLALPQVASLVAARLYARFSEGLPDVPDLEAYARPAPRSNLILAADGTVLAELPFTEGGQAGHRTWLTYEQIPRRLRDAFLAAEDVRFFHHAGVDLRAVARAAWTNW